MQNNNFGIGNAKKKRGSGKFRETDKNFECQYEMWNMEKSVRGGAFCDWQGASAKRIPCSSEFLRGSCPLPGLLLYSEQEES